LAYLKDTVEGTAVIVYVPLKVPSTPATVTESPTKSPWADEVVNVATFEVKDLRLTEAVTVRLAYTETGRIPPVLLATLIEVTIDFLVAV
jgi:hypothetical protein